MLIYFIWRKRRDKSPFHQRWPFRNLTKSIALSKINSTTIFYYYCLLWPRSYRVMSSGWLTRGQIFGKLEEVRSMTSVEQEFGIAHIIVSRALSAFPTRGSAVWPFSSVRPWATKTAEDRYIVLSVKRNKQ